jgi:hypothetical protein
MELSGKASTLHGWCGQRNGICSQANPETSKKNQPGRPPAANAELGPPKKVGSQVLMNDHPIDFLFVSEEEPEIWIKWLMNAQCDL